MDLISIRTLLPGIFCVAIVSGCSVANETTENSIAELSSLTMNKAYQYSQQVTAHLSEHSDEETIEAVKTAAADSLKDPGTAQFHSVRLVQYGAGQVVCGHINGKNDDGAYMGFRTFVAGMNGSSITTTTGEYENVKRAQNAGIVDACG